MKIASVKGPPFCTGLNTLRPRENGRHFADDIFKCIFLNEYVWISLKISLKLIPRVRINNILALVQIRAWRRPVAKPLSEPMMVRSLTHICATRPQWVNMVNQNNNNEITHHIKECVSVRGCRKIPSLWCKSMMKHHAFTCAKLRNVYTCIWLMTI